MSGVLTILALVALAAWLGQLAVRGGFWKADQRLPEVPPPLASWPEVVAVVPARNEAGVIGRAVTSLLAQDYPGKLSLVVVDDRSEDTTKAEGFEAAEAAGATDRLTVVTGTALPPGWTGKMWAVEQGIRQAETIGEASYILLTDADIEHDPSNLRRLVGKAEVERLDLVSLMVRLHCASPWERLLIPAFVFFFQMLYPFPLVNSRRSRTAAAAGGCMLVRANALAQAGGIEAIRSAIIDDVALARMLKGQRRQEKEGAIWLGLTELVKSIRPYDTLSEIWAMVARTAYTQLNYSWLLLIGTVLGMALLFLVPPAVTLLGAAIGDKPVMLIALISWLAMANAYWPTLKLYEQPALAALLLPLAALLYTVMTVDSARRHAQGQGGAWKGRTYSHDTRPQA